MKNRKLLKIILPIVIVCILLGAYRYAVPSCVFVAMDYADAYIFHSEYSKFLTSDTVEYDLDKTARITDGVKFEYEEISFMVPKAEIVEHKEYKYGGVTTIYSNHKAVGITMNRTEEYDHYLIVNSFSEEHKRLISKYGIDTQDDYAFWKSISGINIKDYSLFDNKKNITIKTLMACKSDLLLLDKYAQNDKYRFYINQFDDFTVITIFDAKYPCNIILTRFTKNEIDGIINSITVKEETETPANSSPT